MNDFRKVRQAMLEAAEPNVFDRAIESAFPSWGLKRRKARVGLAAAEAYHGASRSRRQMSEYHAAKGTPDDELSYDLPTLRERSQEMHRNSMIARGIFGTSATAIIGGGLKLHSMVNDKVLKITRQQAIEFEHAIEAEFYPWAESTYCDITRDTNFYGLQNLAMRMFMVGGDAFALLPMIKEDNMPYELRVQLIEAERVDTPFDKMAEPLIRNGIRFEEAGKPVSIFIADKHPLSIRDRTLEWKEYPVFGATTGRRNVIHVYERLWAGQSRGEPILAPILEPLRVLDRWTEAELMATVISAMFTVFVKSEPPVSGFGPMEGLPEARDSSLSRRPDEDGLKMGNAAIVDLATGEDVSFADPKRPNTTFDIFFAAILKQIGMALEIPYEVLIKHFTASYSASRAAMNEAWRVFTMRRVWFAYRFCQPIYEAFVEEAVLKGRVNLPGFVGGDAMIKQAWLGSRWTGPGRGQIDEMKEAQAAEFKISKKLSTRAIEIANLTGEDWEDVQNQLVREEEYMLSIGLDPNPVETDTFGNEIKPDDEGDEEGEDEGDEEEGDKEGGKKKPPPFAKKKGAEKEEE